MSTGNSIRQKDVINVCDGRRLGTISDMEFSASGHIQSLSVPAPFSLRNLFRGDKGQIVIPWRQVVLIGIDVILVDIGPTEEKEDLCPDP